MKELIYLTGQIDSPFFTNEIGFFCRSFDKVHVIVYGEDKIKCDELARKYGFSYEFVNTLVERIKSIPYLLNWIKREYVVEEIGELKKKKRNSLKTMGYIFLYGIYAIAVERIIKKHINPDNEIYLYSFWLSRPAFAIASMNYGRSPYIKKIASRTHRYDIYEEENKVGYLPFRKFISENLDTIYFSSKDTYDYFVSKHYSDKQLQAERKISYLGTSEQSRRKEFKNTEQIVVASCAYIIQRKRLDLIIKLVHSISKLGYKIKWLHIGNGELEEPIKKMAERTLDSSNVQYVFMGRMPDEEIFDLYIRENVDFFVNMSDSEGIPVSVLEALSLGIPCIARDVGGNSDAIINGSNGILVGKDVISDSDLTNLALEIIGVFDNQDKYMKMSREAYEHWKKVFCGDVNMSKVCKDIIASTEIPKFN